MTTSLPQAACRPPGELLQFWLGLLKFDLGRSTAVFVGIREVLRLKAAGLKIREIAASIGAAHTTVYEYLVRAEGAGLSWPLPEDLRRRGPGSPAVPAGDEEAVGQLVP